MKIVMQKNHSLTESERLELGRLLLKAGYTVRVGKEKEGNAYRHFISADVPGTAIYKEAALGKNGTESGKAQSE